MKLTVVKVELTVEEIKLLADLASSQLFRREFIDPKMPGHKCDRDEIHAGKELVNRLRSLPGQVNVRRTPSAKPANGMHTVLHR